MDHLEIVVCCWWSRCFASPKLVVVWKLFECLQVEFLVLVEWFVGLETVQLLLWDDAFPA